MRVHSPKLLWWVYGVSVTAIWIAAGCRPTASEPVPATSTVATSDSAGRELGSTPSTDQQPNATTGSGQGGPVASPESAAGHQRMLAVLDEIRQRTPDENPFLGDAEARVLAAQLASLGEQSPVAQRFETHNKLGVKRLQLGQTEDAIRHFRECLRLVPPGWTDVEDRVRHQLGVAYLRLAENENCVHCCNGESCLLPIRSAGVHQFRRGSEESIAQWNAILQRNPGNVVARWLLNLAHMTLGQYPDKVPSQFLIPVEKFGTEGFPRFQNISQELKLDKLNLAGGMVVEDLNGDGWLDVATSQWSTSGQLRCFLGRGNRQFEEITEQAGLTGILGGLNLIQADYDNDGDVDLLVMRGAWWAEAGRHPKSLLQNDGQANFRDVTFEAGLGDAAFPSQAAGWADYDLDGDLDLYLGNELFPCQLFRNEGQGKFREVAVEAQVSDGGFAKGVTWGDFDQDRYPDLYVSNLDGANRLFRNNRDGTFTNVAAQAGVELPSRSFPTWFWDYNNDGLLDLWVGAYTANVNVFAADFLGQPHVGEADRLYQGQPGGKFRDVSTEAQVHRATIPMGSNFGDLDNDGYLDYYLGTGDPNFDSLYPNRLFHNQAGIKFAEVGMAAGMAHLQKGHGVAFADFDHDGDQDVFIEIGGAYPGDAFYNAVFENPGFNRHWLSVSLRGEKSNRLGVGSRVRVEVDGPTGPRSVYRWVGSGGSFGANPFRVHLGLGNAERVKALEVYWPASDQTQRFTDLAVDQLIVIHEGRDQWEPLSVSAPRSTSKDQAHVHPP